MMHMRKKRRPSIPRKFAVTPAQMHWLHGMLIVQLRRNISMSEFAEKLNISYRQLMYLKTGGRKPGPRTFAGIMGLRQYGVMVHMADFEVK